MANADVDWTGTTEKMAREILTQGQMLLQAQFQSALASDQRATTFASILASVATAVAAGTIALWDHLQKDAFWAGMTMAAMLMLATIFGAWAARPIDFFMPGTRPEAWYDDRKENFVGMIGGAAERCQEDIDANETFMAGNQMALRIGFVVAILSPFAGLLVWWAV